MPGLAARFLFVAVWELDDQDPGFDLIQNGFIAKFHAVSVLDDALSSFRSAGYRVVSVDAGDWSTESELHHDLAAALQFPSYYGRNLSALEDCLRDVAEQDYGWTESDSGLILAIDHFDRFSSAMPETATSVLDIVSRSARLGALLGNRMLCLIRSDDPWLELGRVGGDEPQWNPREWLNANRVE
jgi:hypothetical protein